MPKPQEPEIRRSGRTPLDPDSVEGRRGPTDEEGHTGPVPDENEPGHHPDHEQDKPEVPPQDRDQR